MKKIILLLFVLIPRLAFAHVEEYHNYAGFPLLIFAIILVSSILFYEKYRGKFYGKAVLMSSLFSIFFIELFYPANSLFEFTNYPMVLLIITFSFSLNYIIEKL